MLFLERPQSPESFNAANFFAKSEERERERVKFWSKRVLLSCLELGGGFGFGLGYGLLPGLVSNQLGLWILKFELDFGSQSVN